MQKGTVAKSIIIKVGGGIIEIPRRTDTMDATIDGGDLPPAAVFPVVSETEEPRHGRRRP